ncbi:hypothetical protein Btru_051289 [Bulinus truncatus]|nr:hypothetical protein Btru_051289 [Bulinus truncatus]
MKSASVDTFVGSLYCWSCEHALINYTNPNESMKVTNETVEYLKELYNKGITETTRGKRQAVSPCVRKEYRMLTLDERRRYHNAVNAVKRDTSIKPNKYNAIASIHTGKNNLIAHGGAGFLGWHRIYLLIYETALRQVDPSVCLPYWDSTLDRQLKDPLQSSLWSPDFLGTPRGPVVDGPFANWRLPSGGQLIRNVAVDGDLLSTGVVNDILSRNSYDKILTSDPANVIYNIEEQHGTVLVFVGGAMTRLDTTAFDPVFFLHHAFIDYIFERLRQWLRKIFLLSKRLIDTHPPTAPTGLSTLTQADSYSEKLAQRVTYEPVPTCSSKSTACGNRFLVCQQSSGMCIPETRSMTRKSTPDTNSSDTCDMPPKVSTYDLPHQNDFCSRDNCDSRQWAVIPVKIVSVRPPRYDKYNSFPVINGDVNYKDDLYSPRAYNNTSKHISKGYGNLRTYSRCEKDFSTGQIFIYSHGINYSGFYKESTIVDQKLTVSLSLGYISKGYGNLRTYSRCEKDFSTGQIFIYSHGINYSGFYKESTIVDQKLTVSLSLGFVGIRKPSTVEGGISKVAIRAHDSCGRVCQVACRNPITNKYQFCSGVVAVSDEEPKMFGDSFDEGEDNVT